MRKENNTTERRNNNPEIRNCYKRINKLKIIFLCMLAIVGIVATICSNRIDSYASVEDPLATGSDAPKPDEKEITVLMVGNSMTKNGTKGVPSLLEGIAKAADKKLNVDYVAFDSARLKYYLSADSDNIECYKGLMAKLSSRTYDYVVLQEYARGPVEDINSMNDSVSKLKKIVNAFSPDAKILLYMTHGFCNGRTVLYKGQSVVLKKDDMQRLVEMGVTYVGYKNNVTVVPSGEVFYRAELAYPEINFYMTDNMHPSYEGYFIVACSIYKEIYNETPSIVASKLESKVSAENQQKIMKLLNGCVRFEKDYFCEAVGSKVLLNAICFGEEESPITYKSMDTSIATVNESGEVTFVGTGMTGIIATDNHGCHDICVVVSEDANTFKKGFSFGSSEYVVSVGDAFTVSPNLYSDQVNPNNVTWKASNKLVSIDKNTGYVKTLLSGKTDITISSNDTDKSASYSVYTRCITPQTPKVSGVKNVKNATNIADIKISWNSVDRATNYNIYRSTSKNGNYELVGNSTTKSFVDKGVSTNVTYYYKITANCAYAQCESKLSGSVRALVPTSPEIQLKQKKAGYIKLSWTKNTKATGYMLYRSTKKNSGYKLIKTLKASKTGYKDAAVKPKKTYYYRIFAYKNLDSIKFVQTNANKLKVVVPRKKK